MRLLFLPLCFCWAGRLVRLWRALFQIGLAGANPFCSAGQPLCFTLALNPDFCTEFASVFLCPDFDFDRAFGRECDMLFCPCARYYRAKLCWRAIGIVNSMTVASGAILQPLIGFGLDQLWSGALKEGVPFYMASEYRLAFFVYFAEFICWLNHPLYHQRDVTSCGAKEGAV